MILCGVKWQNELVYLDDLIIFFADADSILSHLDTVLTLLGKHGVTLKAQKRHLLSNEVEYLGHVVRPGRLSVNEKNLKAIKKAIAPRVRLRWWGENVPGAPQPDAVGGGTAKILAS